MRNLIIAIVFILSNGCLRNSNAQNNNQIWTHEVFNYTITLDFETELLKIDTINFYEGYVFYFKFFDDSSYFRLNYISPNAEFECCKEDSIYRETHKVFEGGIFDRKGTVNTTNLYWREIKNEDVEIVYNNCSEEKLILFNKIMDSIYKKLQYNIK